MVKKELISEKKAYDLLYFVGVLTVAALLLSYLLTVSTEMTFEKRLVGGYTTAVLRLVGVNAVMYENVVRIDPFEGQIEATFTLSRYLDDLVWHGEQVELRSLKLHPDDAKIVESFVENQRAQGNPVYYSTATVIAFNGHITEVDIIPECVGWIGLFAVSALILAVPGIVFRKKLIGLFIAWPLMFIVNVFRLVGTVYAGYIGGEALLTFTHDWMWRIVLVAWALILWLFWMKYIVPEESLKKKVHRKIKKMKKTVKR